MRNFIPGRDSDGNLLAPSEGLHAEGGVRGQGLCGCCGTGEKRGNLSN